MAIDTGVAGTANYGGGGGGGIDPEMQRMLIAQAMMQQQQGGGGGVRQDPDIDAMNGRPPMSPGGFDPSTGAGMTLPGGGTYAGNAADMQTIMRGPGFGFGPLGPPDWRTGSGGASTSSGDQGGAFSGAAMAGGPSGPGVSGMTGNAAVGYDAAVGNATAGLGQGFGGALGWGGNDTSGLGFGGPAA